MGFKSHTMAFSSLVTTDFIWKSNPTPVLTQMNATMKEKVEKVKTSYLTAITTINAF